MDDLGVIVMGFQDLIDWECSLACVTVSVFVSEGVDGVHTQVLICSRLHWMAESPEEVRAEVVMKGLE